MGACKFCSKEFKGQALGGHTTNCLLNPNSAATRAKIAQALTGRPLSATHREVVSRTAKTRIAAGTWHNSFSRARIHEYKGVRLYGLWEVAYAKHLDATGVEWRRPSESFPYQHEGTEHRYTPDFYLPATDEYIEVKGWPTTKDRAKWAQFPGKLRVLYGKDLYQMGLIESFKKVRT